MLLEAAVLCISVFRLVPDRFAVRRNVFVTFESLFYLSVITSNFYMIELGFFDPFIYAGLFTRNNSTL